MFVYNPEMMNHKKEELDLLLVYIEYIMKSLHY